MRLLPLAAALTLAGGSAAQAAALPDALTIPSNLDCRQTFANSGPTGIPSWVVADRGRLVFRVSSTSDEATSYGFDAPWLTREARSGGWSWDGSAAHFADGPLAMQDAGWPTLAAYPHAARVVMPHDPVPGRAATLVVQATAPGAKDIDMAPALAGQEGQDGAQRSYWYCGPHGLRPRAAFRARIATVQRASALEVHLPTWFEPLSQEGDPGERGRVRTAHRGIYRLEIVPKGCRAKDCQSLGIFSAKRASAKELAHRTPVRLRGGVRGWVGGYSPGPDWGPVYCGRNVVVWHTRGVNYAIEAISADDSDLVRYANQALRDG